MGSHSVSVQGYKLNALTHFSEHIMDALFHVFILFTALCALLCGRNGTEMVVSGSG